MENKEFFSDHKPFPMWVHRWC